MSLIKRGPIWYYEFEVAGQRFRASTGTSSKAEARNIEAEARLEAQRVLKRGGRPKYTWNDAVKRWLLENAKKRSLETDKIRLRWLTQHLDGVLLADISSDLWRQLEQKRIEEGVPAQNGGDPRPVSHSTINRIRSALLTILNDAHEWGWIDSVPFLHKYDEGQGRLVYFTREQMVQLVAELPLHLALMTTFALTTGLRATNVMRLRWNQINWETGVVVVDGNQTKNKRRLPVPLNAEAVEVLKMAAEEQGWELGGSGSPSSEFVFLYRGRPITRASNSAWYSALERLGWQNQFRWHDTRHTWASWHTMSGTPAQVLKELGGWSSLQMVERYSTLAPDFLATYARGLRLGSVGDFVGTAAGTADRGVVANQAESPQKSPQ